MIRLHGKARRKWLQHEVLESRSMLAGDVSAWQHPLDPNDLNDDGTVSAADALVAINTISGGFTGDLSAKFAPPALRGLAQDALADFVDATGNGHLSAGDALAVINAINNGVAGNAIRDLPLEDADDDTHVAAGVRTVLEERSFAKVMGSINAAGDVDFYRVVPTKANLNITLFSVNRAALTVDLVKVDPSDPSLVVTLESASTEAGSRERAKIDADVEAGQQYFLRVQGAASTDTGIYGLAVLNYSDDQFRPVDSEPNEDVHGGDRDSATELPLDHHHAKIVAHIDPAGDTDVFQLVNVTDGKLIVSARGEVPLSVEVTEVLDGEARVLSDLLPSNQRVVGTVTAGATYYVTVKAVDPEDTGAYRLHVVNAPIPRSVPHDPEAALLALFGRLDDNGDEVLSKEEARPGLPPAVLPIIDRIFNNWDENSDGQLDFAEFEAGVDQLHRRAAVHEPVRDLFDRLRRR